MVDEHDDLSIAAVAELAVDQLRKLLDVVETTGTRLVDNAAIVAEHGGNKTELRRVIADVGNLGQAMIDAVERTRSFLDDNNVW